MPGFDGTGPEGLGPRTGRRRSTCKGGASHLFGVKLFSLIIPAVGAIIHDISTPDGITRKLYDSVRSRVTDHFLKDKKVHLIQEKQEVKEADE